jgi:hypothetical protein
VATNKSLPEEGGRETTASDFLSDSKGKHERIHTS